MCQECPVTLSCHCGLVIPTCITTRAWRTCRDAYRNHYLAVSFEVDGGENVPSIPGACATHNFTYLVRGLLGVPCVVGNIHTAFQKCPSRSSFQQCFCRVYYECLIANMYTADNVSFWGTPVFIWICSFSWKVLLNDVYLKSVGRYIFMDHSTERSSPWFPNRVRHAHIGFCFCNVDMRRSSISDLYNELYISMCGY